MGEKRCAASLQASSGRTPPRLTVIDRDPEAVVRVLSEEEISHDARTKLADVHWGSLLRHAPKILRTDRDGYQLLPDGVGRPNGGHGLRGLELV